MNEKTSDDEIALVHSLPTIKPPPQEVLFSPKASSPRAILTSPQKSRVDRLLEKRKSDHDSSIAQFHTMIDEISETMEDKVTSLLQDLRTSLKEADKQVGLSKPFKKERVESLFYFHTSTFCLYNSHYS